MEWFLLLQYTCLQTNTSIMYSAYDIVSIQSVANTMVTKLCHVMMNMPVQVLIPEYLYASLYKATIRAKVYISCVTSAECACLHSLLLNFSDPYCMLHKGT